MCVTQKVVCKVALLNGANAHRCTVSFVVSQYNFFIVLAANFARTFQFE